MNEYMTSKDAAKALGIGTSTFLRLAKEFGIKKKKVSRNVFYSIEDASKKALLKEKIGRKKGKNLIEKGTLLKIEGTEYCFYKKVGYGDNGDMLFSVVHNGIILKRAKKLTIKEKEFKEMIINGLAKITRK